MRLYYVSTNKYSSYVVAGSFNDASNAFEDWLEKKDYGLFWDRKVVEVKVLADVAGSPSDSGNGETNLLILGYHKDTDNLAPCHWDGNEKARCIAYLEKQKEQKPAEVNVKALLAADRLASAEMTGRLKERSEIMDNPEKYGLQKPSECIPDSIKYDEGFKDGRYIGFKEGVESVKPAEWSEEDEKMLVGIIERGSAQIPPHEPALREEQMEWLMNRLRFLRPQPHWKPSEEQISILAKVFAGCALKTPERDSMVDLFYNLKQMI